MRYRIVACVMVLVTCVSASARADIILINPNGYAVGTDLSDLFAGVSMAFLTQAPCDGPCGLSVLYDPVRGSVLASETPRGTNFGTLTLGGAFEVNSYSSCYSAFQQGFRSNACLFYGVLELSFEQPTDFVQLNTASFSDPPAMQAYDIDGNEIGCWSGPTVGCASEILLGSPGAYTSSLTLARSERDIARVVFGGVAGRSEVTQVRYGVPEPATLSLVGLGLLGMGIRRRRRKRAARP